jgi:hypothetical protein
MYDTAVVKHSAFGGCQKHMRATRRRQRTPDSLASPAAVRAICASLRERLPEIIPNSEKHLLLLLYAVRHVERRPATDTRRGRPSRWKREDLLKVAGELRILLKRETSGRVSLSSFIASTCRCSTSLPMWQMLSLADVSTFKKRPASGASRLCV